jgi:hypothetical protein
MQNSFDDVRAWAVNGTFGVGSAAPNEGTSINTFYPSTGLIGTFSAAVRVATTGNIALNNTQTVDGIDLVAGDRVLVKNQTAGSENGIYDVVAGGAWTRSATSDASAELIGANTTSATDNQAVNVLEGDLNSGTNWRVTNTAAITLGTTAISITTSSNYTNDVAVYISRALATFDDQPDADNVLNYIAREHWISSFGNGVEAYNLYRRTGKPTGMQPALNPSPSAFPRSMWYPAVFATLNSTVTQKTDLSSRIFWDTNPANLDF